MGPAAGGGGFELKMILNRSSLPVSFSDEGETKVRGGIDRRRPSLCMVMFMRSVSEKGLGVRRGFVERRESEKE